MFCLLKDSREVDAVTLAGRLFSMHVRQSHEMMQQPLMKTLVYVNLWRQSKQQ